MLLCRTGRRPVAQHGAGAGAGSGRAGPDCGAMRPWGTPHRPAPLLISRETWPRSGAPGRRWGQGWGAGGGAAPAESGVAVVAP